VAELHERRSKRLEIAREPFRFVCRRLAADGVKIARARESRTTGIR